MHQSPMDCVYAYVDSVVAWGILTCPRKLKFAQYSAVGVLSLAVFMSSLVLFIVNLEFLCLAPKIRDQPCEPSG
jgi:hypothetical protein